MVAANKVYCIRHFICRAILFLLITMPVNAALQTKEYQVKAAFIIKLVPFVSWPEEEIPNKNKKLNFCFFESSQQGAATRKLLLEDGNLKKNFNVLPVNQLQSCHILFISKTTNHHLDNLLRRTRDYEKILTIGDSPSYANKGVMINFFLESGKIRFEVNWKAMKANNFKISSRILKLARIVDE